MDLGRIIGQSVPDTFAHEMPHKSVKKTEFFVGQGQFNGDLFTQDGVKVYV